MAPAHGKNDDESSCRASLEEKLKIKITDEDREEIKSKNQKMEEVFERAKTKLSENSPGFFYSMYTGFVLLINNVNFGSKQNERTGSDEDVKGIQEFFEEKLGWRVEVKDDLKASEIKQVVTNTSQCEDFPYKALFIIILTHGSEKGVQGVDKTYLKVQSLVDEFKDKEVWNIPKFFVIQACRGDKKDISNNDRTDQEPEFQNEDAFKATKIILPEMSNFLVAHSCLEGYVALRNVKQGSWFIKEFLKIAHKFYKTENIVDIFNRVNFEVSNIMADNRMKQMPIYEVGLRQRCFFHQYFIGIDAARSMSLLSLENRLTMNKAFIQKPAPEFEAEAVKDGKFQKVKLSDYKGKYVVLFFYPLDFTIVCLTEIIAFSDRAKEFRKLHCEVIACSVDSQFSEMASKLARTKRPRIQGGLGKMDIPIVSDLNKQISRDYGVLLEDDGISLRGLFIIDDKGILQQITVNDLSVGRDVDEILRLVQAFQYVDKHGEVCPANWKPGKDTVPTAQN